MANILINYCNLEEVKNLAMQLGRVGSTTFIVQYPGRNNYNITMNVEKSLEKGAILIWPKVVKFNKGE